MWSIEKLGIATKFQSERDEFGEEEVAMERMDENAK